MGVDPPFDDRPVHEQIRALRFQLQATFDDDVPDELRRRLRPLGNGAWAGDDVVATVLQPVGTVFPRPRLRAGAPSREALVALWDDRWGWASIRDQHEEARPRLDEPDDPVADGRWDLESIAARFERWDRLERELVPLRATMFVAPTRIEATAPAEDAQRRDCRLRPPLDGSRIDELEAQLGWPVPDDLRRLVTEVGDGFDGGKALRPLAASVARSSARRPFPFDRRLSTAWSQPAAHGHATPTDLTADGAVAGTLDLGDLGCATVARLVIRGDELGSVWWDDRANDGGLRFWRTSLRSYVERWLDDRLDESQQLVDRLHGIPLADRRG